MVRFLKERERHKIEKMDDPNCDKVLLENTYRQFATINRLLSRWRWVYQEYLKPSMVVGETYSLLDIGAGGGDIARLLLQWAEKDGYNLVVTAIDSDARAIDFMSKQISKQMPEQKSKQALPKAIEVRFASTFDLVRNGEYYDFVISNNVLHHLSETELSSFLSSSQSLAKQLVIHNDIVRDDLAYLGFACLSTVLFHRSFVQYDGLLSIQRSFTKDELAEQLPPYWRLHTLFPYRHLLTYKVASNHVS